MAFRLVTVFSAATVAVHAAGSDNPVDVEVVGDGLAPSSLDFMVMGDWGGLPEPPYKTVAQADVAKQLGIVAGKVQASYTLALGDNFYFNGVTSNVDPRFRETFEDVFTDPSLQAKDHFRLVAGNHDHYGNCSAQIAYTAESERWHFPHYYYDFEETLHSGVRVHHVMVDTVLLAGQSSDLLTGEELPGSAYPGPKDPSAAEAQWAWIESTLAKSTAHYLIVAGHFPVWSICEHGPTKQLVDRLRPMLEKHRVSMYLAGHDHCAQHLDEGRGVQYHGIGAGIEVNESEEHKTAVPKGSLKWHYEAGARGALKGAFGHVSVSDAGLVVAHWSSHGKKLYEAAPIPPRTTGEGILQI